MIEHFVAQSLGEWRSMRSGHSLAFKQFEEVISSIKIKEINIRDSRIKELILNSSYPEAKAVSPFSMEWTAHSDWNENENLESMSGKSLIIPIETSKDKGMMIRSRGYAEKESAVSSFNFLSDGTLKLMTSYKQTYAEERIWFLSNKARCRASVIRSIDKKSILQTSFASELRVK